MAPLARAALPQTRYFKVFAWRRTLPAMFTSAKVTASGRYPRRASSHRWLVTARIAIQATAVKQQTRNLTWHPPVLLLFRGNRLTPVATFILLTVSIVASGGYLRPVSSRQSPGTVPMATSATAVLLLMRTYLP